MKWESGLIKEYMPRDINSLCNWIKTAIPLVLKAVPKKDT